MCAPTARTFCDCSASASKPEFAGRGSPDTDIELLASAAARASAAPRGMWLVPAISSTVAGFPVCLSRLRPSLRRAVDRPVPGTLLPAPAPLRPLLSPPTRSFAAPPPPEREAFPPSLARGSTGAEAPPAPAPSPRDDDEAAAGPGTEPAGAGPLPTADAARTEELAEPAPRPDDRSSARFAARVTASLASSAAPRRPRNTCSATMRPTSSPAELFAAGRLPRESAAEPSTEPPSRP
mmetsp:Transcript_297/g.964  ORF Transcript_297/g.964 Transcript_297/m.964 type:complete len:237 (+) Transcript_297:718-1428(+)